uniref:Uncharacterized protein n=1 Tax=Rhizophagus irregularis (strain DAOM 181602 / DAOM 197198 / MUCL 43194) TaxID=747089 RepID=U9U7J6_RHIID
MLFVKWILETLAEIPKEMIVKSFKKCGISNAMDGSEDDLFGQDENGEEIDENEREIDEIDLIECGFDFELIHVVLIPSMIYENHP